MLEGNDKGRAQYKMREGSEQVNMISNYESHIEKQHVLGQYGTTTGRELIFYDVCPQPRKFGLSEKQPGFALPQCRTVRSVQYAVTERLSVVLE